MTCLSEEFTLLKLSFGRLFLASSHDLIVPATGFPIAFISLCLTLPLDQEEV